MAEDKVARICWNTNYWQFPSGMEGKVTNSNSGAYESVNGYGHEEWLLDTTKLIDGFHYAHIQAIGQNRSKYLGESFNISLYSINSKTKERWWLGEIKNVIVVGDKESKKIYKEYKKKGWLKEMRAQLIDVDADIDEFDSISPEGFCCVKYEPKNLHVLDEPRQFSHNDPAIKSDYYNLKNKISNPTLSNLEFDFKPGHNKKKDRTTSEYKEKSSHIDLVHNQMQESIYNILSKKHGKQNISTEQETGNGTKIDIVLQDHSKYVFYEIKTSNTSKLCIREALSQLLEYAYYPESSRANKLVIVTPVKASKESVSYLNNLRERFKIPIYYQHFDIEKDVLGKEC